MIITENQLDEWVRGNSRNAQGVIVELVWRLVAASSPRPKERRFPLGDSIGQPGPDGVLDVDYPFEPFVPEGRSFWEIGTGINPGTKATSDYRDLVAATPDTIRLESEFLFVTPLSGRRDWPHTWKEDAQASWLEVRRNRNEWRDVRVIDGTKLIDWLSQFPSVELWLAQTMGIPIQQINTPELHWDILRTIGEPPQLIPQVFLVNRDEACAKLKEVLAGNSVQLKLETHFPDQMVDFVSACIAALDADSHVDAAGRCLVISGVDAWNAIAALREKHILIADPFFDLNGEAGTKLIQKARRAGHSVIFCGPPGGIPDPSCIQMPRPRSSQIKEALEKAGYSEERARILSQKSDGNLGSLLRCLQNLSLMPEWAESSAAADLAVAVFLGGWNENSAADRSIVENISKKAYGEWIGLVREVALRPGTPLTQWDGVWKFASRYEGWYALGPRLFDEHLDRLRNAAIVVLKEKDPKFELPADDRYAAHIRGKILAHSPLLRNSLAESLALLGSHARALTSCSLGKAEATALVAVREILDRADWVQWASLNHFLPLLAEASPSEFLCAVETALSSDPCPFDELFAQEGDGVMGETYISGLLWALETLAWDPEYISRVVICLGELAARDPGGRWANRPANSLTTILLPWMPQTCASITKRGAAVTILLKEFPGVGWKLLLSLLPKYHSVSSGSRKPAWREMIPDDWSRGVTHREYWEQIDLYSGLAISAAKSDLKKLIELIDHLENLPPGACEHIITYLESPDMLTLPDADRLGLWTELANLVAKHRKFADAPWAMNAAQIDKIDAIADRIAPTSIVWRHQRLFNERDSQLYEEKGNYGEQRKKLERRRQSAVHEITAKYGIQAITSFAASVQSPWSVGMALGAIATIDADKTILPDLLVTEQKPLAQFAGGFVWGRFHNQGWAWVDEMDFSQWKSEQVGQLLAYLPFTPQTWNRSTRLLGSDELSYWTKTSANPYDADSGLELAIDQLIAYGRPHAAIRCLYKMLHDKQPIDAARAVRALLAALNSSEGPQAMDADEIVDVIKSLQDDLNTNPDDLFRVEWAYLQLLDRHRGASPKLLERKLSKEPEFFCEMIRLVFRPNKDDGPVQEATEAAKSIAANAYDLLSKWQTPPGCMEDGKYDGSALAPWVNAVEEECKKTGHLEVAMIMVGHALTHIPPDPSGLWIHHAAAEVLNEKDAEHMRDGFRTELFNSRGVHWVDPTGKPEMELARKYKQQADEADNAGYQRLAATIRSLADSYTREAERIISEHKEGIRR